MLVLTRKEGESIMVYPSDDLDLSTPIGEVFRDGAIKFTVFNSRGQVSIGIDAPRGLLVLREELTEEGVPTSRNAWHGTLSQLEGG